MESTVESYFLGAILDVECATRPLDEIANVLSIFDELLQDSVKSLDPAQPWTGAALKARITVLISMLVLAERELRNVMQRNNDSIRTLYSAIEESHKADHT